MKLIDFNVHWLPEYNNTALNSMSSSDSFIEGALISVGGKNNIFLPIFTSFFLSFLLL